MNYLLLIRSRVFRYMRVFPPTQFHILSSCNIIFFTAQQYVHLLKLFTKVLWPQFKIVKQSTLVWRYHKKKKMISEGVFLTMDKMYILLIILVGLTKKINHKNNTIDFSYIKIKDEEIGCRELGTNPCHLLMTAMVWH